MRECESAGVGTHSDFSLYPNNFSLYPIVAGHGLAVVAVLLVQCCIDMWHTGVRLYEVEWKGKCREDRLRILRQEGALLAKNAAGNVLRGGVSLVGACVGASVGSVVWVGTGTWVGECFIPTICIRLRLKKPVRVVVAMLFFFFFFFF